MVATASSLKPSANCQTCQQKSWAEIVTPLAAGLALGWLASLAIGRAISALLYNTAPTDPIVALATISLFLIAAATATILPCRRAASIDPMEALRAE